MIVFLPTQFGKHFWPNFSFILGQRIDYLSPTVYISDILIGILFMSTFLKKQIRVSWYFLFFVLYLFVATFFSQNPAIGWYMILKFVEFSFFTFATKRLLQGKEKVVGILFCTGIIVESLVGLLQYIHQGSLNGFLYFLGERTFNASTPGVATVSIFGQLFLRPYATFSHPNVFAGYLLIGMIFAIFFLQSERDVKIKMLLFFSLLVGSVGLFFTFSRSATFLWILFMYSFFLVQLQQKLSRKLFIVSISCIVLGIFFFLFPQIFARLFFFQIDESVTHRTQLFVSAFRMLIAHPFFGVGLGNFLVNLPQVSGDQVYLQPVHNIFLLIACETGLCGLIVVLWNLLQLIPLFKKIFAQRKIFFPLCSIGVAIVGIGMVDHYFLTLQQGQLLLSFSIGSMLLFANNYSSA